MRNGFHGGVRSRAFRRAVIPALISGAFVAPAAAFEFSAYDGGLTGSFDTTVSVGAQWRTQDRDDGLIGASNGGTTRSQNGDDGNLNYEEGELVSLLTKVTHEIDLKAGDVGLFSRILYSYDAAIDHQDSLDGYEEARDKLTSEFEVLDLFVHGQTELGGTRLSGRLGNQVVSWGESTFIGNSINTIAPLDVRRLRSPGAELKEGLLPTPIAWASAELNETVSVEGFYQFGFNETRLDPRGSYFSTTDLLSPGADAFYAGWGRRNDQHFAPQVLGGATLFTAQAWLPRERDHDPEHNGQYGLATRVFLSELAGTEFGVYYINYHSRTPILSVRRGGFTRYGDTSGNVVQGSGRYYAEYPDDIHLWGLSFNTAGPAGIAIQGEWSYRTNQPLQHPGGDLFLAATGAANSVTGDGASAAAVPEGAEIAGYKRVRMHQFQVSATKSFPQVLGAEQLVVLGEVGYTRLGISDDDRLASSATVLPASSASSLATSFGSYARGGFATKNSWGYRLLFRTEYPDVFSGVNVTPRLAFSHDVSGFSPTFSSGSKAASVGLGFSYQNTWQWDIAYTAFFGGNEYSGTDPAYPPSSLLPGQSSRYKINSNSLADRDFLAVSLSYSF